MVDDILTGILLRQTNVDKISRIQDMGITVVNGLEELGKVIK